LAVKINLSWCQCYPAASPNVLGVGGTILTTGAGNVWSSEVGWDGSGGGVSQYESQPSYQNGVVSAYSTTKRTVPDVSMSAGAVPVYDSWDNGTQTPWTLNGRTSLSAPCWAGIIAVADQGATLLGKGTLSTNQVQTKLYNLYQSGLYQTAFHDIIASDYVSTNTYSPRPGYDLSTGLGSPRVDAIVAALSGNYGNTPMLVNEQRLFAGKGRQRTLVFQLDFSTALNAAVARKTGHYSVVQDIRAAAQYRPAQTKRIPVRAAKYKPGNNSVTLTLGRYTALNELQLTATGLIGATGTPAGTIVTKL
jgi:subtilase family serine protease